MAKKPASKRTFFSELKRRHVFRVVGVYAGVAFAILQLVDIIFPILQLPEWTMSLVLVLMGIGFPIAAILAWLYDITPDGVIRTSDEIGSPAPHKPFTSNIIIAVLIVIIVGLLVYPKIQEGGEVEETPSIAILLIENIGDKANEFWTRGITEDVIIELAKGGHIRVTPIQEILKMAESGLPLNEIADALNVKYFLTSSLYKTPEGFDFRTQLIEAESGTSIYANKWSEPADQASVIPSMLAKNILTELNLSIKIPLSRAFIPDPEAYEFYLKAKYRYSKRKDLEDTEIAKGLYNKAIELDSLFLNARLELGLLYQGLGEYDTAQGILDECLPISRAIGDRVAEARMINSVGLIQNYRGQFDEALVSYHKSLEINTDPGGEEMRGHALNNIGIIKYRRGKHEEALKYYNEALQIRRDVGNRSHVGSSLNNIANVHKAMGETEKALDLYNQSLQIALEMDEEAKQGQALGNIASLYTTLGNYDDAMTNFIQSLEIERNLGNRREEARTLDNMANINLFRGNYDKSLKLAKEALTLRQEVGDQRAVASSFQGLGYISMMREDYDQAFTHLNKFNSLALANGEKGNLGFSTHLLGECYLLTNKVAEALKSFQEALQIWVNINQPEPYLMTLSWETLALAMNEEADSAISKALELDSLLASADPEQIDAMAVNWKLSQIYALLENETKAVEYLNNAHTELLVRADELLNEEDRKLILTSLLENREIMAAWRAMHKD